MSNISCSACQDVRSTDPLLLMNGLNSNECASLKNDTGLVASKNHNNNTDLENLNDCLVGALIDDVGNQDACEWRGFTQAMLTNIWTTLKAMICSDSGIWVNIHNLWNSLSTNVERIDNNVGEANDNIGRIDDNIDVIEDDLEELSKRCPYRVGDLYITLNNTNPSEIWENTTWSQIKNCQLVAAGGSYTLGQTYGAGSHAHTTNAHALSIEEMPQHVHGALRANDGHKFLLSPADIKVASTKRTGGNESSSGEYQCYSPTKGNLSTGGIYQSDYTGYAGASWAHSHGNTGDASNLFTSLAVNVWKRES